MLTQSRKNYVPKLDRFNLIQHFIDTISKFYSLFIDTDRTQEQERSNRTPNFLNCCRTRWNPPKKLILYHSNVIVTVNHLVFSITVTGCRYYFKYLDSCTSLGGHTSKPVPDSDSDPDSDSKKIRTREKPGPGLEKNPDSYLKKPGLDFWKPGLEIDKTVFKTRTLCTRMQRFFGKV